VLGLFQSTQATRKATPRVPAGSRVYAIGDIHGRLDLLEALHEEIEADARHGPVQRNVVVYLGDYVDRGADSRDVIEYLIEEPLPGFESIHLMGNHEAFLLQFLEDGSVLQSWTMNGGDATLASYGVNPLEAPADTDRAEWLRNRFRDLMPVEHHNFFCGLKLSHVEGDYLFVHAGVRPGVPIEQQDPLDLLWIREPFLRSSADFGKLVVHGHTPVRLPERKANRIDIDTGAVYGGKLTALVLEDHTQLFLQV
jgi:serine/threonine protein phosphatase 1